MNQTAEAFINLGARKPRNYAELHAAQSQPFNMISHEDAGRVQDYAEAHRAASQPFNMISNTHKVAKLG